MAELQIRKRARGIDRAFDILDHLRDVRTSQRPAEIAQALGAPTSTVSTCSTSGPPVRWKRIARVMRGPFRQAT